MTTRVRDIQSFPSLKPFPGRKLWEAIIARLGRSESARVVEVEQTTHPSAADGATDAELLEYVRRVEHGPVDRDHDAMMVIYGGGLLAWTPGRRW